MTPPPLRRIHDDATLERAPHRYSLAYWRSQPSEKIIESLAPGGAEPLLVKPDGRVFNGNTRIKVLEERGVEVNNLPREAV